MRLSMAVTECLGDSGAEDSVEEGTVWWSDEVWRWCGVVMVAMVEVNDEVQWRGEVMMGLSRGMGGGVVRVGM